MRLQALSTTVINETKGYGSQDDEVAALKSLSKIESNDQHLKELVISHFMTKYGRLSEVIYIILLPHIVYFLFVYHFM